MVEATPNPNSERICASLATDSVFAGPASHAHPVASKRPPAPTPGHYADAHPDLLERSLPVPVRWAGSLRMTERPVNHGDSRGSLPPLAPTHTHVHARVTTVSAPRCPLHRVPYVAGAVVGARTRSRRLSLRCRTSKVSTTRCPLHRLPRRPAPCIPSAALLLFITAVPNTKLCAWGEEDSGGHVQ